MTEMVMRSDLTCCCGLATAVPVGPDGICEGEHVVRHVPQGAMVAEAKLKLLSRV